MDIKKVMKELPEVIHETHVKSTFKVDVWDVWVNQWYYGFKYVATISNGDEDTEIKQGEYENDHGWHGDESKFLKHLTKGGAALIVLQEII